MQMWRPHFCFEAQLFYKDEVFDFHQFCSTKLFRRWRVVQTVIAAVIGWFQFIGELIWFLSTHPFISVVFPMEPQSVSRMNPLTRWRMRLKWWQQKQLQYNWWISTVWAGSKHAACLLMAPPNQSLPCEHVDSTALWMMLDLLQWFHRAKT